jgi:hypothetical protein
MPNIEIVLTAVALAMGVVSVVFVYQLNLEVLVPIESHS